MPTTHFVIPDTQVRPGVPMDHCRWIGRYIMDRKPDVVVHLGDHWDMPSLSYYDRGKLRFEGRRYKEDVQAGNTGLYLIDRSVAWHNQRKRTTGLYVPRKVLLRGNHEDRIERVRQDNSWLDGLIGLDDLDTRDWEVHDFLEVVWIDGLAYSHYFYNPMTGHPLGGQVATRLKNIGHSFVMGHQQTLDYALRPVGRGMHHGLVAGASYLHDEDYKGPQGNSHWRGVVVLHQVEDGSYDPMFVSLDYLCRRYEEMRLEDFIEQKYVRPARPGDPWTER